MPKLENLWRQYRFLRQLTTPSLSFGPRLSQLPLKRVTTKADGFCDNSARVPLKCQGTSPIFPVLSAVDAWLDANKVYQYKRS